MRGLDENDGGTRMLGLPSLNDEGEPVSFISGETPGSRSDDGDVLRLCIDCAHHRTVDSEFLGRNGGPFCGAERAINLVTGKPEPLKFCGEQRYVFHGRLGGCGTDGTLFKAKDPTA